MQPKSVLGIFVLGTLFFAAFLLANILILNKTITKAEAQTTSPPPSCVPRPRCLDATPPCLIAERIGVVYCGPSPTPIPFGACQQDSDCHNPEMICYQPPMPTCPSGSLCPEVMPAKKCLYSADLNHDGKVDLLDYSILMSQFGKTTN